MRSADIKNHLKELDITLDEAFGVLVTCSQDDQGMFERFEFSGRNDVIAKRLCEIGLLKSIGASGKRYSLTKDGQLALKNLRFR